MPYLVPRVVSLLNQFHLIILMKNELKIDDIETITIKREEGGKSTHTPRLTNNFSQIELLDVIPNWICSFFHHWIVNGVSGGWCAIKLKLTF